MAKIVVFANQKGGVAKTTTAEAVAAMLKRRGYRTLAIDIDPQGNLSDSVGVSVGSGDALTIYEVLKQEAKAEEAIQKLDAFDIIPADIVLASADQTLVQSGKEYLLKEALDNVIEQYDYIIIDTPPALNVLTVNAFTCGDELIIPTTAGIFAAKGIKELSNTVLRIKKYFNSRLEIRGILLTKFNPRTNNSKDVKEITEKLSEYINVPLFNTYIRNCVAVEEAQTRGIDLFSYKENTTASDDYSAFVDEYLGGAYGEK